MDVNLNLQAVLVTTRIYDSVRRTYIKSRQAALERLNRRIGDNCKHDELYTGPVVYAALESGDGQASMPFYGNLLQQSTEPSVNMSEYYVECPIPEMNLLTKLYLSSNTAILTFMLIKYVFICITNWGLIDKKYVCYIPGRANVLGRLTLEYPSIILTLCVTFLIYYYYAHSFKTLDLDVFAFLMCTEETVLQKEQLVKRLNRGKGISRKCHEEYIIDSMFYRCVSKVDSRFEYQLKPHRTVKQWRNLRQFVYKQSRWRLIPMVVIPIGYCFYITNIFSHQFFKLNYAGCEVFSSLQQVTKTNQFEWSFLEPYRLIMLVFDCIDTIYLIVDLILVITFVSQTGVIISTDLELRLREACDRLDKLNDDLAARNYYFTGLQFYDVNIVVSHTRDLNNEIVAAQEELVDLFKMTLTYDKFMTSFTSTHIVLWIVGNLFYQLMSMIYVNRVFSPARILQFNQAGYFVILCIIFYKMGRPHDLAIKLYHKINRTIAYDKNIKETLPAWLSILEFYHEDANNYSLHSISKGWNLSFLYYVRAMSWFVTCSQYALGLARYFITAEITL